MSDEGVHEIQLNGKQLVFMFMAVTVVAVVIFLCGVMVGRGVRAPRATEPIGAAVESPVDPTASVQAPAPPSTDAPSSTSPASSQEKLTYADRLIATTPPSENLKEPVAREMKATVDKSAADKSTITSAPRAAAAVVTPAVKRSRPAAGESKAAASATNAGGYVVQVAAYKVRGDADTVAKRLASKGFPSFVTPPSPGAAGYYRVRVGKYSDRREAESVARRLEKEEQFNPWITR